MKKLFFVSVTMSILSLLWTSCDEEESIQTRLDPFEISKNKEFKNWQSLSQKRSMLIYEGMSNIGDSKRRMIIEQFKNNSDFKVLSQALDIDYNYLENLNNDIKKSKLLLEERYDGSFFHEDNGDIILKAIEYYEVTQGGLTSMLRKRHNLLGYKTSGDCYDKLIQCTNEAASNHRNRKMGCFFLNFVGEFICEAFNDSEWADEQAKCDNEYLACLDHN